MKRPRSLLLPVFLTASLSGLSVAEGTSVARELAGCPLFPSDSIWNVRIDSLPPDPSSDLYVETIGPETGVHPDFGSGDWPPGSGSPIGIPFDVVSGSQPQVPVTFFYEDESDPGPYPIPPDALIEGGPGSDGDRHVLVLEQASCTLYELFDAAPLDGGASWTAGSGAVFPLGSYALRPDEWTSADAAGLPILPGLVRFEEVEAGRIGHALRFTAPETRRAYTWPARHFASSLTDPRYPPMGQRFRLRSDLDLSGFSPRVRVILQALKEYGMMLADNGSAWFVSGVPDERWDNDELADLAAVKGSDFEAVDVSSLTIDPDSSRTAPECTGSAQTVVSDTSILDEQLFEACDEVRVGPDVSVFGPDGRAIFNSGNRVVFLDGVAIFSDGRVEVAIGPP